MATKKARKPSVSDQSVKAKTGKDWAGWFRVLDRANAAKLPHKEIAKLLASKHDIPGWWSQMITVEYEIARGLRALYQHSDGFSFTLSKTLPVSLEILYAASAESGRRKNWLPKGALKSPRRPRTNI